MKAGSISAAMIKDKALWDGRVIVRRNAAHATALMEQIPAPLADLLPVVSRDGDPVVRRHVSRCLGHAPLSPARAYASLLPLALDRDEEVQRAARKALEALLVRERVVLRAALVDKALHGDDAMSQLAAELCLVIADEALAESFCARLSSAQGIVRARLLLRLEALGDKATDALIGVAEDEKLAGIALDLLEKLTGFSEEQRLRLAGSSQARARKLAVAAAAPQRGQAASARRPAEAVTVAGFAERVLTQAELSGAAPAQAPPMSLLASLSAPSAIVRTNAARLLAEQASGASAEDQEEVAAELAFLVRDDDALVRSAAMLAATRLLSPSAARILVAGLRDPVADVTAYARVGITRTLAASSEAVDWVMDAARRLSPAGRDVLSALLVEGGATLLPALARALAFHGHPRVRALAAAAIGRQGPGAETLEEALRSGLADTVDEVRRASAEAVGRVSKPTPELLGALERVTRDPAAPVRRAATAALDRLRGRWRPPQESLEARQAPVPGFDEKALTRLDLSRGKGSLLVEDLLMRLRDGRAVVRQNAALALGLVGKGSEHAWRALVLALKDSEEAVQIAAAETLAVISAPAFPVVPALVRSGRGRAGALDDALFESISSWGTAAFAPLLSLLGEDHAGVARLLRRVVEAEPKGFAQALAERLGASYPLLVREGAAELLSVLGRRADFATPVLLLALADTEASLRARVVRAIGMVAQPRQEVVAALLDVARADPRPAVRQALVQALKSLR